MNHSSICKGAETLSNYPILQVVMAVKIVFCLLGIVATAVHFKQLGIAWLVHPNAKVLYMFHIFWSIYVPLTYSIAFSTDFIRFLLPHDDPCDYTISTLWGIILRALPVLGLVAQSFTMLSFAIERIIATLSPVTYENVKSRALGVVLGLLSILGSSSIVYYILSPVIHWSAPLPLTAVRVWENGDHYQLFLSTYIYLEISTITIFAVTLVINYCTAVRPSSQIISLSNKYQVNENKHLIITLLPCFMVHCLLNLIPILGLKLYNLIMIYDQAGYAAWVECWAQAQTYSLLMPLIIYFRLRLRKRKVTDVHNTDAHFVQLNTIFNKRP